MSGDGGSGTFKGGELSLRLKTDDESYDPLEASLCVNATAPARFRLVRDWITMARTAVAIQIVENDTPAKRQAAPSPRRRSRLIVLGSQPV
jgi:hypothetical protein